MCVCHLLFQTGIPVKCSPGEQKGSQGEQKGSQGEQIGSQGELKNSSKEQKSSTGAQDGSTDDQLVEGITSYTATKQREYINILEENKFKSSSHTLLLPRFNPL